MKNRSAQFNREVRAVSAGLVATITLLILSACSGGSTKVRGLRDDVKFKAAVSEVSHRVVKTQTKQVCTARNKKGACTATVSRPAGTKSVKVVDRAAKPATYCVEVDNLNGKAHKDDVWFTVSSTTYWKVVGKDEGDKVKFDALHEGCRA